MIHFSTIKVIESDPEDDIDMKQETSSLDMDTDISQLEAPTFTTLADRGPSQAMLNLQWHHTANLIGKKVQKDHFWDSLERRAEFSSAS